MADWPIKEVEACVNGKWGDADVVFQNLRKPLIKSEDAELLTYVALMSLCIPLCAFLRGPLSSCASVSLWASLSYAYVSVCLSVCLCLCPARDAGVASRS